MVTFSPTLGSQAGQTALILAAKKGHIAAVEALLKIGVDRNLRDDVSGEGCVLA